MVVISVCFLPASYAIYVVKERAVKAKHQQVSQTTTSNDTDNRCAKPHNLASNSIVKCGLTLTRLGQREAPPASVRLNLCADLSGGPIVPKGALVTKGTLEALPARDSP